MRNLRYLLRLTYTFIYRFKGVLLIGTAIGLAIFFSLTRYSSLIFGSKTERIGVTGRYHTDELPKFILQEISSGLTSIDANGTPVPALAKSWESPDKGKTWIFTLKDNIFWHDGTKITSDTIVYEFSDVKTETPDPATVVFKLDYAFSPFPSVVSKPTFLKGLIGTGDWKVTKIEVANSYVSELNLVDKNKNKKIYRFYPTESQTKLAYKKGKVDEIVNVFDTLPISTWSTVDVEKNANSNQIVTLFFNTEDKILSSKSVRQALIYAIDKTNFSGQRAIGPIPPNSWAYNSQVKKYTYDTERAKELLETVPEELLKEPVKIVSTPFLLPVAETIANYWKEVGVNTEVQVSSIVPSEFQVYLTIFDAPDDPDQYSIWHSTQESSNISNYKNDRIDKLLEDGRLELDTGERKKIYLDFQRFLVEDSPAAFLYHPETYILKRK